MVVVVVVLDFVVAGAVVVRLTGRVEVAAGVVAVRVPGMAPVVVVFVVVVPVVALSAVPLASPDGCAVVDVDEEVVAGAVETGWTGNGNGLLVTEAIN